MKTRYDRLAFYGLIAVLAFVGFFAYLGLG